MATTPLYVANFRDVGFTVLDTHGTRPRKIFTAGANGSRVHFFNAVSQDTHANVVKLYKGHVHTLVANMGVGALSDNGGSPDTITRTTGSFITDGWVVGDRFYLEGATTLANDVTAVLTGVAADTLTFVTGTLAGTENLPAGSVLYRIYTMCNQSVAARAGDDGTVAAHNFLNSTLVPGIDASPNSYFVLEANKSLFVQLGTVLTSIERFTVLIGCGDY